MVIAIIGVLVALLLPAVQAARGAARRTACSNNLRQVSLAVLNYESAMAQFPPGQRWTALPGRANRGDYSWMADALPYIEEGGVHEKIDFRLPYLDPSNRLAAAQVIEIYLCPSTSERDKQRNNDEVIRDWNGNVGVNLGCTDYLGIAGPTSNRKNRRRRNGTYDNRGS